MTSDPPPEHAAPTPVQPRRRRRILLPTLVVLVLLAVGFVLFTSFYTDLLWYRSIGFSSVFSRVIYVKLGLFVGLGVVMALVVGANVFIAYRLRPPFRPQHPEQESLERYRRGMDPYKRIVLAVIALAVGLLSGASAASQWRLYLLWRHHTSFGVKDAQFHRDVSFYTFDLPWYRYLLGFAFAIIVLSLLASLITHYLYGGIRLQTPGDKVTPAATAHISVLLGLFVLLKAFAYWLDRFALAVRNEGLITGLKYRDVHAVLPAKNVLLIIALICAGLFFANAFRRTWALPGVAFGLLVLAAILIGGVYPALVQQFSVRPNEAIKEAPYISRNIAATRTAYGLDKIVTEPYDAKTTTTAAAVKADSGTIQNVRLLDPAVIPPTYDNLQRIRSYYGFASPLDIDRYEVDGQQRESVVAVREVETGNIAQQNWINDHITYTHGYGFVAAYGNTVNTDGSPDFYEGDLPPTGTIPITQPRIYFGETSPNYSIVGAPAGTAPVELDYPDNSASGQQNTTYTGTGGVSVGSPFRRLLYAVKFEDQKIILSNYINKDSRILYERSPRERVQKAAPWLTIDSDPYPAVVDGRIVWIVDGYTTSDDYPYSTATSLASATSDSVNTQQSTVVSAQRQAQVNYVRNSVKATVDAYDGTVTLYAWDATDPVLQTWMKAFPGTVKPRSDMSADLLAHIRYPEDLFKIQRNMLTKYHVTDPASFYNGQAFWRVPDDPTVNTGEAQPPYYLTITMPGTPSPVFSLTTAFSPVSRQNLSAFMQANSAPGPNYGTLTVLQLPGDSQVPGPGQVQNSLKSDPDISRELTLLDQGGSAVTLGNLLSLPVGGGFLYVEPMYVSSNSTSNSSYPLLRYVQVAFGDKIGFDTTFSGALKQVFGAEAAGGASSSGGSSGSSGSGGSTTASSAALNAALAAAQKAYDDGQAALKKGDFTAYGAAQTRLAKAIQAAQAAAAAAEKSTTSTAPKSTASPKPSSTASPSASPSASATATGTTASGPLRSRSP